MLTMIPFVAALSTTCFLESQEGLKTVNVMVRDDWKTAVASDPEGNEAKTFLSCLPKSTENELRCEGTMYQSQNLKLDAVFIIEKDGLSHLDLIMWYEYHSENPIISTAVYTCKK